LSPFPSRLIPISLPFQNRICEPHLAAEVSTRPAAMEDEEHEVYGQEIPVDGEDVDMAAGDDATKVLLGTPSPPAAAYSPKP
jgi:hypothetical protein